MFEVVVADPVEDDELGSQDGCPECLFRIRVQIADLQSSLYFYLPHFEL